jgi:hypothetical protein
MNSWRTSTVVQLCQAIREGRDYSALPILADALQDAEYPDEQVLEQLRSGPREIDAQRLVALIYSDKTAESVAWIEAFASQLGPPERYGELLAPALTYATLMEAANLFVKDGWHTEMGTNETYKDLYEQFPVFWTHYEIVTGVTPRSASSFFACSC